MANREKKFNRYFDTSFYLDHVKRYLDTFGIENVKIIVFEEFIKNPDEIFKGVLDFLDIESDLPSTLHDKYGEYTKGSGKFGESVLKNESIIRTSRIIPRSIRWKLKRIFLLENKPEISKEDRMVLEDVYRQNIIELQNILKRKFPWYLNKED